MMSGQDDNKKVGRLSYQDVVRRIRKAEAACGRPEGAVELVAVSKVQPEDRVRAVLEAGHRLFGENRVQEAEGRWTSLKADFADLRLHLIGPLQTNKARQAVGFFDAIETVDREKLARKLAEEIQGQARAPDLYVQVNTGEEPQKAGVAPGETDAFIAKCRQEYELPIVGLMVIPPAHEPPAPHFALLAKLAERNGLNRLSMGMSADFETAIQLGATSVRVGSAVFGARDAQLAAGSSGADEQT